jgi:hypothetical protein
MVFACRQGNYKDAIMHTLVLQEAELGEIEIDVDSLSATIAVTSGDLILSL